MSAIEAKANRVPLPRRLKLLFAALGVVIATAVVLRSLPTPHGASRVRAGDDIRRAHTDNSLFEGGSFPRPPAAERAPYDGKGSCRVSGIVTDQSGHAVEGCPISIEPGWGEGPVFFFAPYPDAQPVAARSDAEGRYVIEGVAAGTWLVGPSAPARPPEADRDAIAAVGTSISVPAGQAELQLDLRVHRGLYIRGSIVSASGPVDAFGFLNATVAGARVTLNEMTDRHGKFVLGPLVPGRYSIVAAGQGDYRDSEAVEASPGDEGVVLTLRPGGSIAGWVEDAATGDPCQAKLTLSGTSDGWPMTVHAWTHDSGDFGFDGLTTGSYDICARTGERKVGFARAVKVREGETAEDIGIRLEPGCVVRVRCTVEHPGDVTLSSGGCVVASALVYSDSALVDVVPAGRLTIRFVARPGAAPEEREIELAVGDEKEVVFGGN